MKPEIQTIISDGTTLAASVDRARLNKLTTVRDLQDIDLIPWETVKELHILGYGKSKRGAGSNDPGAGCYIDQSGTWVLVVGATKPQVLTIVCRCRSNLKHLDIRFLSLPKLNIRDLVNLEQLCVSTVQDTANLEGYDSLVSLKMLDMSFADLPETVDLHALTALQRLDLTGNLRLKTVEGLSALTAMEELDLSGTGIGPDFDVSALTKLRRLRLADTRALRHIIGLGGNPELEHLDLACSAVERIPDDLHELKHLVHMDLSNMGLDDVPDWLPELGLEFTYYDDGINLRNTTIPGVEPELFSKRAGSEAEYTRWQEEVRQWFEDRKNNVPRPLNELKVVFLGDGGAGKSHIIARLMNDGGDPIDFTGDSTPGVLIKDKKLYIEDRNVRVHFWDFGGQNAIQFMHRMFLSARTLYVVVINMGRPDRQNQARFWLRNIQTFAPGAPVLLVLNQMDHDRSASINEADLRKEYPNISEEVVKLSAMKDSREDFLSEFMKKLKHEISKSENLNRSFQLSWHRLRDKLQAIREDCIPTAEYEKQLEDCGIDKTDGHMLLEQFRELGICYHYAGSKPLEEYVVLRPNWIANALSVILFQKHDAVKNGVFPHQDIRDLLAVRAKGKDRNLRILPDTTYQKQEVDYILHLMRRYQLSYPLNKEEFIPLLCGSEPPADFTVPEHDTDYLEYHMEYPQLPDRLIPQLVVQRRRDLEKDKVWRTGACFKSQVPPMSAIVLLDETTVRIFVRSEDPRCKPGTYLNVLKDEIEKICQEAGVGDPEEFIVYKADGKRDCFSIAKLTAMQTADPSATDFSLVFMDNIPIAHILGQLVSDEES